MGSSDTRAVTIQVRKVERDGNLGFARTQSVGTIIAKRKTAEGKEANREVFVVKKTGGVRTGRPVPLQPRV